ncbi:hypothetical protein [Jiangella alba]|uniref:Uncharacterized protein n=1 Tax=Jiangella alba TaxID=561176 RepID=A0A1H5MQ57_9ACTN|nr:hypothetical protein [Jiangella alba]SEE91260.1 hypothetical protein SAMN04488561_3322 [Jiangella alba]
MSDNTITPASFNDPNHWRVDMRGPIDGQVTLRSYHLAAATKAQARHDALHRWAAEFDEIPFIVNVERYAVWRYWELQPEGRMGMSAEF